MNETRYRLLIQEGFDTELPAEEKYAVLGYIETNEAGARFHESLAKLIACCEDLEIPDQFLPQHPEALAQAILRSLPPTSNSIFALVTDLVGRLWLKKLASRESAKPAVELHPRHPEKAKPRRRIPQMAAEDHTVINKLRSHAKPTDADDENRRAQSTSGMLRDTFVSPLPAEAPVEEQHSLAEIIKRRVAENQKARDENQAKAKVEQVKAPVPVADEQAAPEPPFTESTFQTPNWAFNQPQLADFDLGQPVLPNPVDGAAPDLDWSPFQSAATKNRENDSTRFDWALPDAAPHPVEDSHNPDCAWAPTEPAQAPLEWGPAASQPLNRQTPSPWGPPASSQPQRAKTDASFDWGLDELNPPISQTAAQQAPQEIVQQIVVPETDCGPAPLTISAQPGSIPVDSIMDQLQLIFDPQGEAGDDRFGRSIQERREVEAEKREPQNANEQAFSWAPPETPQTKPVPPAAQKIPVPFEPPAPVIKPVTIDGIARIDRKIAAGSEQQGGKIPSLGPFLLDAATLQSIGNLVSAGADTKKLKVLSKENARELQELLVSLGRNQDLVGSVIVSYDGFTIASTLPAGQEYDAIGTWAMAQYMSTLNAAIKFGHKKVVQLVSRTPLGYVLLADFGGGLLVCISNNSDTDALLPLMRSVKQLTAQA